MEDQVNQVRLQVLRRAIETGAVPSAAEVATQLALPETAVGAALRTLAETHVYVLEPGDPTRIRMANPFSAVPTAFAVTAGGRSYFGNCVWDALGIVSLLGGEGGVKTSCPDCGEALTLRVSEGRLVEAEGVVHFSVPARHWWDDILHT